MCHSVLAMSERPPDSYPFLVDDSEDGNDVSSLHSHYEPLSRHSSAATRPPRTRGGSEAYYTCTARLRPGPSDAEEVSRWPFVIANDIWGDHRRGGELRRRSFKQTHIC